MTEVMNQKHSFRFALLGCHAHADKFGEQINAFSESDVKAVWDEAPEKSGIIARALSCARALSKDEIFNDSEIDAVVISCMNDLHRDLCVKAAKKKKSIFLEKPLAGKLGDGYAIRDAVKKSGVSFYMSDPFVNASTAFIKDFMESGKLGRLLSVRIRFSNGFSSLRGESDEERVEKARRMGGGVMTDTGGHPLHILNYLLGNPENVMASFSYQNEAMREAGCEDQAMMIMEYPDGLQAVVEAGTLAQGFTNSVEVFGTRGCIQETELEDHSGIVRYKLLNLPEDGSPADFRAVFSGLSWVNVPKVELGSEPDQHIRFFVRMLAEKIPNEAVGEDRASLHGMSLDKALEVLELIDAVKRSAKTGKKVMLPKVKCIDYSPKHDILIENPDGSRQPMDEPYFTSEKVTDGVFLIRSEGDFSYLVEGSDEALVIDSGYGAGNIREYAQQLTDLPVRKIANTHEHFDHTACNAYFDLAYMSEKTEPLATIPYPSFEGIEFPRDYAKSIVKEGDTISLGDCGLEVFLIPDHTPGGTAYLDKKHRILFSGDEISDRAQRISAVPSFLKNLEKLSKHLDEFDLLCAGPGVYGKDIIPKLIKVCKEILNGAEGEPVKARTFHEPEQDAVGITVYKRFMPHPPDRSRAFDDETMKNKRIYQQDGIRVEYSVPIL